MAWLTPPWPTRTSVGPKPLRPVENSQEFLRREATCEQTLRYFGKLKLKEFSVVDDYGLFIRCTNPKAFDSAEFANGLSHFVK